MDNNATQAYRVQGQGQALRRQAAVRPVSASTTTSRTTSQIPAKPLRLTTEKPQQKARAKARAQAAGRPYPNLVDNAAARRGKGK